MANDPLKAVLTVAEVARIAGVSRSTVQREAQKWLADGTARRADGTILIRFDVGLRYAAQKKTK